MWRKLGVPRLNASYRPGRSLTSENGQARLCTELCHERFSRALLASRLAINLGFLRRPTISFGARAAHQHRSLAFAQAIGLEERLDGLLVVDDGVCACPVRAPQTAVETPGVEHAGERIPDVRKRIRFLRERAGAAHL